MQLKYFFSAVLFSMASFTMAADSVTKTISVKQGDMLWDIARQIKPETTGSIYQIVAALVKSNPNAFIDGNPNRMKSRATLTVDMNTILQIDHDQAVAMFRSHWQGQPATTRTVETTPVATKNIFSSEQAREKIKQRISKELQATATSIKESSVPGLYEVIVPPRVFYVSADGRYVMTGDLVDLEKGVNITSDVRDTARLAALKQVSEKDMIVFSPKGEVKHTISVFTDIDCGYCRKLHNEIADYNKLGIKVRYLAYPRAGVGSGSYKKAVTVWCSDDKKAAMTNAKNGQNLPNKECKNPVQAHMALGKDLGVNGTPAIMLENGQLYPGYAPAKQLIKVLDQIKTQ